jgi:diacylglycerol kinase family enzyme
MNVVIVANPVSGSGDAPEIARRMREGLDRKRHDTDLFITKGPGDAEQRAAEEGPDTCVISVGGDGTIREIVNGVDLSAPPRLMVYPTGTGNVLAGELRMPVDVRKQLALLERGLTRWIDVGVCEDRRFLCMAGIGFDADVVHAFHECRDRAAGMWTYSRLGFQTLYDHEEAPVDVYVDGTKQASGAPFVQIASTRNYGGPLLFSPSARPDNGHFEVSWLSTRGKPALFRFLVSGCLGLPGINPDYHTVRGATVRIEPVRTEPMLQLDGDPGPEDGRTFRLRPRAVPFLTPTGSSV